MDGNIHKTAGQKLIILCVLALCGCGTMTPEQEGEIIGGVIGGVLGAQVGEGRGRTAAIIIGSIAGSMIGRHIGETMNENDRNNTAYALNHAKSGDATSWVNPDTGNRYSITPTQNSEQNERPCREFRLDARVGDRANEEVYGIACLQEDGSWLVQ